MKQGHLSTHLINGRAVYSISGDINRETVLKLSALLIEQYGFVLEDVLDLIDVLDLDHRRGDMVVVIQRDAFTECDLVAGNPESDAFVRKLAAQIDLDTI